MKITHYLKKTTYLILDILFSPLLTISCIIMKYYRRRGIFKFPLTKTIYKCIGLFPIRDHYYEPLFSYENIPESVLRPKILPGIPFPEKDFLHLLNQFDYCSELLPGNNLVHLIQKLLLVNLLVVFLETSTG